MRVAVLSWAVVYLGRTPVGTLGFPPIGACVPLLLPTLSPQLQDTWVSGADPDLLGGRQRNWKKREGEKEQAGFACKRLEALKVK